MNRKGKIIEALIISIIISAAAKSCLAVEKLWIEPRCTKLNTNKRGPFIELSDGNLIDIEGNSTQISKDEGKTWSQPRPIYTGDGPGVPSGTGVAIKTESGVIVLVYYGDLSTSKWEWINGEPAEDMRLDIWVIRSLDDGETWIDRQLIAPGYCGALNNIIQTKSGHIVVPIQALLRNPGRHGQYVYVSVDDGKTWKRSNLIDLGGAGDHDGAIEGTVTELSDGRLLMLLRTSLDRFWEAYSDDHGYYWRELRPSRIDASAAPGQLKLLTSGVYVLVWNRLYPEGKNSYERRMDKNKYETTPSRHREELSIAFSQDDCKTWTKPVVIARHLGGGKRKWISYPYIFERRPGDIWITTGYSKLRVSIKEADFVKK